MQRRLGINCHATDAVSTTIEATGDPRSDVVDGLAKEHSAAQLIHLLFPLTEEKFIGFRCIETAFGLRDVPSRTRHDSCLFTITIWNSK
jgi:hypothetical protein